MIKMILVFLSVFALNLSAEDVKNPCGALLCILGGQTSGECKGYYEYYSIGLPQECAKQCKYNAPCTSTCIPAKQIAHLKNCKLENGSSVLPSSATNTYNSYVSSTTSSFTANLDSKINEASQLDGECTKSALNRVESKYLRTENYKRIYAYRINPNPTKTCQILAGQTYSTIKISYHCNKQFYEQDDWNNGYTKQIISKDVYDSLNSKDRGFWNEYKQIDEIAYYKLPKDEKRIIKQSDSEGNSYDVLQQILTIYYQKIYIEKDCWKVEEKSYN